MRRDSSPIFIALCDLLLCVLAVVIAAVNPKADAKQIESKADFIITAEWDIDQFDADVDLWALPPPGKTPVFFRNREAGLMMLDQDCLGKSNSTMVLADGSVIATKTCRETMTIRKQVPGKYDLALNLYHFNDGQGRPTTSGFAVKVRVQVLQVNPFVKTMYAGEVTLDHVKQTINFFSFTLSPTGSFEAVPPPIEPVTNQFESAG